MCKYYFVLCQLMTLLMKYFNILKQLVAIFHIKMYMRNNKLIIFLTLALFLIYVEVYICTLQQQKHEIKARSYSQKTAIQ